MTGNQPAPAAFIAAFVIGTILLYFIPSYITMAKLYRKAGKPAWTAWIPVYQFVVMSKIAQMPLWVGIVVGLASLPAPFGRFVSNGSVINNLLTLVLAGFGLWLLSRFIQKYDRGLGFWVLWIFLPIVAMFLAGKATYKGTSRA